MAGLANGRNAAQEKQLGASSALPQSRQDVVDDENEAGGRSQPLGGLVRVKTAGESGRRGIHPLHFFKIIWHSSSKISRAVNVLWPFVPAALAVYYTNVGSAALRFSLAYIAMVPCANLIGFSGAELARKMPHMLGVLTETTCVQGHCSPMSAHVQDTNGVTALVLSSKSSSFSSFSSVIDKMARTRKPETQKTRTSSTSSELPFWVLS